jgi:hypothetical protein
LNGQSSEPAVRVWALTGARAGDNDQVIALSEALGVPFEIKQLEYNRWRLLGPRLLGRSLISLTRASRSEVLAQEPPDLTVSGGHRSVPVVQALRHRSGGRTRSIHVGFPRASPGLFDLVIATPQYPIAEHPNLLRVPYALTTAAIKRTNPSNDATLADLPRPRRLIIVGGPNLYWKIDEAALLGTIREALADAEASGGSVLVTTSPRTPPPLRRKIAGLLGASSARSLLAAPGQPPPYACLLEAADSIRVTADSVAMISDAIWSAKEIALVRVSKRWLGGAAMAVMDLLGPGKPIHPQDLRFFWRALEKIGVTERLALPATPTSEEMDRVLVRVAPILEAINERGCS